jgi:hypothetical protein
MQRINWTITRIAVMAIASIGAVAPVVQALAGVPGSTN